MFVLRCHHCGEQWLLYFGSLTWFLMLVSLCLPNSVLWQVLNKESTCVNWVCGDLVTAQISKINSDLLCLNDIIYVYYVYYVYYVPESNTVSREWDLTVLLTTYKTHWTSETQNTKTSRISICILTMVSFFLLQCTLGAMDEFCMMLPAYTAAKHLTIVERWMTLLS